MKSQEIGRVGEELVREIFGDVNEKSRFGKFTPDFSAQEFWIDSKVAYGSLSRFLRDYESQFKNYMEFFERGVVIYWRGYSTVAYWAAMQRGIKLISGWELMRKLEKKGLKRKFLEIISGKLEGF